MQYECWGIKTERFLGSIGDVYYIYIHAYIIYIYIAFPCALYISLSPNVVVLDHNGLGPQ